MRAAGLPAYLVKPFAADKCIAIVERVLAERRLRAYKEASRLYISEGAVRGGRGARRAAATSFAVRADERGSTRCCSRDICGFTSMSRADAARARWSTLLNELLRRHVPDHQRAGRRHRQVHRRRDHGGVRGAARSSRQPRAAARGARRPGHAGGARRASTRGAATIRWGCASASTPGRWCAATSARASCAATTPCIGDMVNRAQRYEAKCPLGGVLISARRCTSGSRSTSWSKR